MAERFLRKQKALFVVCERPMLASEYGMLIVAFWSKRFESFIRCNRI